MTKIFTRPEEIEIGRWKAATVRVQRGDRWLSENVSVDYNLSINPNTLVLANGKKCICGQIYRGVVRDDSEWLDGFDYARRNLFTEANHWVSKIVGAPNEQDRSHRGSRVAAALGFVSGSVSGFSGYGTLIKAFKPTDQVTVTYSVLQEAWVQLLAYKAAQRIKTLH